VAGASGPAAQAAALARWFNSGRYRYTLSPPVPSGPDPLTSFLLTTRAGFCQQFAAAYGVLARIDGLPTRVAVGFTTGTKAGRDRYQVTGADAHVWPEVYLGPDLGWTSFEPTPATTGEPAGLGVSTGVRTQGQKQASPATGTTASTVPSEHRPGAAGANTSTTPPTDAHGRPVATGSGSSSTPAVAVVAVVLTLVTAAVLGGRWARARRRSRRGAGVRVARRPGNRFGASRGRRAREHAHDDPDGAVLALWRDAEELLGRAQLGKRPAETIDEHAARLRALAGSRWLVPHAGAPASSVDEAVAAYGELAALAVRASYGAAPCTPDDAAAARHLDEVVRTGIGGGQVLTRL